MVFGGVYVYVYVCNFCCWRGVMREGSVWRGVCREGSVWRGVWRGVCRPASLSLLGGMRGARPLPTFQFFAWYIWHPFPVFPLISRFGLFVCNWYLKSCCSLSVL